MIKRHDRKENRAKRHKRVRVHVAGTQHRPRLAVFRSLNHLYAQLIDDDASRTLAAASTVEMKVKGNGVAQAAEVGKAIAAKAKAAGVSAVVFDRGGFLYHGRIKALADAARERSELADRVVRVNRVAKVVKGGRKFSFSALIVVGDMNGRVGAGIGKAREVTEAIRKGMDVAKRNMITVPMVGTTIPHEVNLKWGAARIMLKPAAPGTGVISGGAMRAVIETAGIKDILTKSHGTNNPINTVRATLAALQQLRTAPQVAELRGREVEQMVGKRLAAAYKSAEPAKVDGEGSASA